MTVRNVRNFGVSPFSNGKTIVKQQLNCEKSKSLFQIYLFIIYAEANSHLVPRHYLPEYDYTGL